MPTKRKRKRQPKPAPAASLFPVWSVTWRDGRGRSGEHWCRSERHARLVATAVLATGPADAVVTLWCGRRAAGEWRWDWASEWEPWDGEGDGC